MMKKYINKDPQWVNKLFHEACSRLWDSMPIAGKITVEITPQGADMHVTVNGMALDQRGLLDAHEGVQSMIECRGCGRKYKYQDAINLKNCTNCGVAIP